MAAWIKALALGAGLVRLSVSPSAVSEGVPERVVSRDGRVALRVPTGAWACGEATRDIPHWRLTELACAFAPTSQVAVRLFARDYQGPSGPLEALCGRNWHSAYGELFSAMHRATGRVVGKGPARHCEVVAEGLDPAGAPLLIEDSYRVVPGHVLLVSIIRQGGGPGIDDAYREAHATAVDFASEAHGPAKAEGRPAQPDGPR